MIVITSADLGDRSAGIAPVGMTVTCDMEYSDIPDAEARTTIRAAVENLFGLLTGERARFVAFGDEPAEDEVAA